MGKVNSTGDRFLISAGWVYVRKGNLLRIICAS